MRRLCEQGRVDAGPADDGDGRVGRIEAEGDGVVGFSNRNRVCFEASGPRIRLAQGDAGHASRDVGARAHQAEPGQGIDPA